MSTEVPKIGEEEIDPPWYRAMELFNPIPQPASMIFTSVTITGKDEDGNDKESEAGVLTVTTPVGIQVYFMSLNQVIGIGSEMAEWVKEEVTKQQLGLFVANSADMKEIIRQGKESGFIK